jgi:hypothetical protein
LAISPDIIDHYNEEEKPSPASRAGLRQGAVTVRLRFFLYERVWGTVTITLNRRIASVRVTIGSSGYAALVAMDLLQNHSHAHQRPPECLF